MTRWRAMDVVRLTVGAADLLTTTATASAELGSPPTSFDLVVYRVLGVRQVGQAWLTARTDLRALGAVVDVLHAASMLPVIAFSSRWRRAATLQAAFATSMAIAGFRAH